MKESNILRIAILNLPGEGEVLLLPKTFPANPAKSASSWPFDIQLAITHLPFYLVCFAFVF